ncbi:MAG: transcription antitermination factor NusB, partial [Ruminococcus sp.]|nr:transcription antitermination factor NusB [Ruminococcus sp.]
MAQHEMTRHETRECAFYILFEMQFQNDTAEELFQVAEEADLLPITDAVKEMVNGVVAHEAELDEIISAYSTKRVINRIPKVNLSILRLALYEIRYDAQMPMNAAIAEAISLAKAYGYQEDISFING